MLVLQAEQDQVFVVADSELYVERVRDSRAILRWRRQGDTELVDVTQDAFASLYPVETDDGAHLVRVTLSDSYEPSGGSCKLVFDAHDAVSIDRRSHGGPDVRRL